METIIQKRNYKKLSALGVVTTLLVSLILPVVWPNPINGRGHIKISKNSIEYFETVDVQTGLFTQAIWEYNGTFQGYHWPFEIEIVSVTSWFASSKVKVKFDGVWNETDKGTFQAIVSGASNPNLGYPNQFKAKLDIIKGTGTGDLEGICGSGTMNGEELEFGKYSTGTYEFHFRFGEECK